MRELKEVVKEYLELKYEIECFEQKCRDNGWVQTIQDDMGNEHTNYNHPGNIRFNNKIPCLMAAYEYIFSLERELHVLTKTFDVKILHLQMQDEYDSYAKPF